MGQGVRILFCGDSAVSSFVKICEILAFNYSAMSLRFAAGSKNGSKSENTVLQ